MPTGPTVPANPFAIYTYQWPILDPGPSWSVSRISMPRFFSIQWDFQIDSWYYIGHGIDADPCDRANGFTRPLCKSRFP